MTVVLWRGRFGRRRSTYAPGPRIHAADARGRVLCGTWRRLHRFPDMHFDQVHPLLRCDDCTEAADYLVSREPVAALH